MPRTFTCHHCGKIVPRNPRIKKQNYCSSLACQNARKRLFDRITTPISKYKMLQQKRNKRWRAGYPAHEYQKRYRDTHPAYEKRNQDLQRKRNKKRHKGHGSMIVKTDTLLLQPLRDGAYMGFKIKNGKIVKTDALLLQMQVQTGVDTFSRLNPG